MPTADLTIISIIHCKQLDFRGLGDRVRKGDTVLCPESRHLDKPDTAKSYAISAYTAALLASQISNDTANINQNLVVISAPQQPAASDSAQIERLVDYIEFSQEVIFALLSIVIILLIINIVFINMVMKKINPGQQL